MRNISVNKWTDHIAHKTREVNLERVSSIAKITGNEVREYVFGTLDILSKYRDILTAYEYALIETTLEWSEISKCGSPEQREEWKKYLTTDIRIHNEASAEIYGHDVTADGDEDFHAVVRILIATHGLLGQAIRGEVKVSDSTDLAKILEYMPAEKAERIILILNECIVSAISEALWEKIKREAGELTDKILRGVPFEYSIEHRLRNLLPRVEINDETKELMAFYSRYQLWYMPAAFQEVPASDAVNILAAFKDHIERYTAARHIMFQPLMNTLYYDYMGKKKLNIYKLRVIQHCMKNGNETEHCRLQCVEQKYTPLKSTVEVNFVFSPVCEALLNFCVEAENSGVLSYEKSITLLYDTFGFRLDPFDRLNNEDSYLSTMNDTETSTKDTIIDYVVGDSIVDVGSGGGVLLNKLEEKYPDARVIGTDISASVIDKLNEQKKRDGRKWTVERHNFVEGPFSGKADNIIFSSILHEIYSYTEFEGTKFNLGSVYTALKNACASLNDGGRIIIRDGIRTDSDESLTVTFKTEDGYKFFLNYVNDFKGPLDHRYAKVQDPETGMHSVTGDINFMREFLYTFTWGQQSYAHEVQEQFGYLTLKEYTQYLRSIGLEIVVAKEFFEEGYRTHLQDKVILDKEYPNSNCIIAAEKRYEK